jgi:hypothetical protein
VPGEVDNQHRSFTRRTSILYFLFGAAKRIAHLGQPRILEKRGVLFWELAELNQSFRKLLRVLLSEPQSGSAGCAFVVP